ncbi:MAG TPA: hypothetical protein ENJ18_09560 [Nannocystis exedens]|nr:hypothetical protein [Nannocystis exedens]
MQARPAIPPGREADLLALVEPYQPGAPVTESWQLQSINTEVSTIHLWLSGPGGAMAHITLDHPEYAPPEAEVLGALAWTLVSAPEGSEQAIGALRAAIVAADDGTFWRRAQDSVGGAPAMLVVDDDRDRGRYAGGVGAFFSDGMVLFAALVTALLMMFGRLLSGIVGIRARLVVAATVAAITAVAVFLRSSLSPAVGLTAWPFVRVPFAAERVYEGPLWSWLGLGPLWLSDAITGTTWVLACLAPLAIFLHAYHLLVDRRAALVAAGLCALLPLHIRFSHSDVAFIASITISSLTFALLHSAARERGPLPALLALLALAPPLALTFLVRPLNILYAPLLLLALVLGEGIGEQKKAPTSRRRQWALAALVLGVSATVGVPALLGDYSAQLREGLSFATVERALGVVFSLRKNTLINPSMTPPLLPLLALVGAVGLWRRRKRRLLAFLGGWLVAFFGAHAYVIPREPLMQARYHLHLIVPFLYLASIGVVVLLGASASGSGRRWRPLLLLGGFSLVAAPVLHTDFITDVDLNEVQEWRFVHGLREVVPEGCTIVEFTPGGVGSRFARVGAYASAGAGQHRWQSLSYERVQDLQAPPLASILRAPPTCLYIYEGLTCAAFKRPGQRLAEACMELRSRFDLEVVAESRRRSRPYDENLSAGLVADERIVFRLYKLKSER